ncbi:MAG: hybrid sensor histidine kinase/response regulator [Chloroflexi bacterium]|uniref:histidine kinase n=1 Tax=Candidatus Chlorohelix allophototropha TaxID=3003348 RepID=A0A8T7M7I3_9CHLR|nr:hybrid sensor histidine kinase/response regulator [Chloroflexota bacterium]WJW69916.1 hybrid sensor histidine kinase/response regulator [Chloroflexota bacterium L227-S17]
MSISDAYNRDRSKASSDTSTTPNRSSNNSKKGADISLESEVILLRQRLAEYEAELRSLHLQNEQLRERLSNSHVSEKERAEFISNVAHELRSPLTSIKGYVDLLLEGEAGDLTELQNEFLCVVGANNEKLARIISDLLDVSRLESGRLSFNPGPRSLREIAEQAIEATKAQFEAKSINFVIELPVALTRHGVLEVNVDPDRLIQAIKVLLSNSTRYTPNGGTVKFSVQADEADMQAIISITDQSPPINQHEIPALFTKFWQSENPAWRETGSPGLSLALVKAIAEMHDGNVSVVPNPAGTNTFTITLPLLITPQPHKVTELTGNIEVQHAVLVITQNPMFAKFAEEVLSDSGFQVVVTEDYSVISSPMPAWIPDLILADGNAIISENKNPVIGSVPLLQVSLSELEMMVLAEGAVAVLPYPASDSATLEYILQIIGTEVPEVLAESYRATETILLVSQVSSNLRNLDKLLRDAGFTKVYRATMEYDALALARRYRPSFMLVDLNNGKKVSGALFEALNEDPLLRKTLSLIFVPPDYIMQTVVPDYQPGTSNVEKFDSKTYTNHVPKPFLRRRFLSLAKRLVGKS